jgi:hypothetical protein
MENNVVVNAPQIHVRYDGRSYDLPLAELDIGDRSTDEQVRTAVADHLGVPVGKLRAFTVDRNAATGEMTLRPDAIFG